jgi:hypothetical protein
MNKIITLLCCIALVSCVHGVKEFVQGDIRIRLPVRQEKAPGGSIIYAIVNDGGTTMIKIIDARGRVHEVYFDRRFESTTGGTNFQTAPGTIYLDAYPGRSNSVLVTNQELFKRQVLKHLTLP